MSKKISDNERQLFRKMLTDVQPLTTSRVNLERAKPSAKRLVQPDFIKADLAKVASVTPAKVAAESVIAFKRKGLSHVLLQRLKQGELPCEASIDLHGFNQCQAEFELAIFIRDCYEQGMRCVKVIHGKGKPAALLKNIVNIRLREYDIVEAFYSAPIRQGGTGAVLVLLRSDELI